MIRFALLRVTQRFPTLLVVLMVSILVFNCMHPIAIRPSVGKQIDVTQIDKKLGRVRGVSTGYYLFDLLVTEPIEIPLKPVNPDGAINKAKAKKNADELIQITEYQVKYNFFLFKIVNHYVEGEAVKLRSTESIGTNK